MNTIARVILYILMATSFPAAHAGEGDVVGVYIESVGAIASAFSSHQAGNMELKILGGFTVPAGLACSNIYITTLKVNDPDKELFALATAAQVAKLPVLLHITDDPAMTAFPGRCSLMAITAGPTP